MSTSRRTERAKITLWSIMWLGEEEEGKQREGRGEEEGRRRGGGGEGRMREGGGEL